MSNLTNSEHSRSSMLKLLGARTSRLLFLSILIGVAWFIVEAMFIYILQFFLLCLGLVEKSQTLFSSDIQTHPSTAVIVLFLYGLLRSSVFYLKIFISGITNQSFIKYQRMTVLKSGLSTNSALSSHEITSLFNETIVASGLIVQRASEILICCTCLIFFFGMSFYLAPTEIIVALCLLGILIIPFKWLDHKIHRYGEGLKKEYDQVSKTLSQSIKNKLFLNFTNTLKRRILEGEKNLEGYERFYTKFYLLYALKLVFPSFLGLIILSLISFLSLEYTKLEPLRLLSFFYIFLRMCQSAGEISGAISDLKLHKPSLNHLKKFSEDQSHNFSPHSKTQINHFEKIEFKNVVFNYSGETILEQLNLSLVRGEIVVIRGASGSGKSTLIQLMCGLLSPSKGQILVDNKNANDLDLRNIISYSGPEPFLIDGTIRENLLYGLEEKVTEEELLWACDLAKIKNHIDQLPGRLNYALNEDAQLSSGQKQRLALTRIFLKKNQIIVMDEATNNLNIEIEKEIIENIERELPGRLVILISHRDSIKHFAHREITLPHK